MRTMLRWTWEGASNAQAMLMVPVRLLFPYKESCTQPYNGSYKSEDAITDHW